MKTNFDHLPTLKRAELQHVVEVLRMSFSALRDLGRVICEERIEQLKCNGREETA